MTSGWLPIARTVTSLRAAVAGARAAGQRVALVPTMGALHEGHLSLVREARRRAEFVIVTLFVNPAQFNDPRDLAAYPRTEDDDARVVAGAGASLLFAPPVDVVYPPGFSTTVDVGAVAEPLEGEARGPVHFRGVATVVTKLLNMARPDVALFGQKDAQQTLVIRRLAVDLDLGVEIVVCPTVREPDGLAMSSRNRRLDPSARVRALGIVAALRAMERVLGAGTHDARAIEHAGRRTLHEHGIEDADIDYVAVADGDTLRPLDTVRGAALFAIAAHVGGVRLIDNVAVGDGMAHGQGPAA